MGLAEPVISVVGLAEAVVGLARVIFPDSKQRSVKTCNIDLKLCKVYPIPVPGNFWNVFGISGGRPTGRRTFCTVGFAGAGGAQVVSGGAGPFTFLKKWSILNLNVQLCLRIP